jgi:hypothetical protein
MIKFAPQPGPQTKLIQSTADIVIYGGAAGGGKTFGLLLDPLRYVNNSGFRGVIFRRTMPQIENEGGLLDTAQEVWPLVGGRIRRGKKIDCTFPSGARIAMRQLQYENTKYEYQGAQIAWIGFDELTHFTRTQFFYLLTRNRSTSGVPAYVRCTCNPEAGSWVGELIAWWIDQETGYAIPERSGVVRYFISNPALDDEDSEDKYIFGATREEVIEQVPDTDPEEIFSLTFIPSMLADNPKMLEKDPRYRAKLKNQPKIERERLLEANWLIRPGSIIDMRWFKRYYLVNNGYQLSSGGSVYDIPFENCRRFATLDTAGTSKEKAAESKGASPSYSVSMVWDHFYQVTGRTNSENIVTDILILVAVFRDRVAWNELKIKIPEFLNAHNCRQVLIENAHFGQPLSSELSNRFKVDLVGPVLPGMDGNRDAKLERAVASGFLSRLEFNGIYLPAEEPIWMPAFKRELGGWSGMPGETADQIDNCSYACYHTKTKVSGWGGVI